LGIWLSSRLDAFLTFGGATSPVRASEKTATAALPAGRFLTSRAHTRMRPATQGRSPDLTAAAAAHFTACGRMWAFTGGESDFKALGAFLCKSMKSGAESFATHASRHENYDIYCIIK
jgi:hypothetical protein